MDTAIASIIVALIGTIGTVIVTVLQKFRNENKADHGAVMKVLEDLHSDVEAVDKKIDGHIIWHLNDKK